jgi:hypothetical protein
LKFVRTPLREPYGADTFAQFDTKKFGANDAATSPRKRDRGPVSVIGTRDLKGETNSVREKLSFPKIGPTSYFLKKDAGQINRL